MLVVDSTRLRGLARWVEEARWRILEACSRLEELRGPVALSGFVDGSYDHECRLVGSLLVLSSYGVRVDGGGVRGGYGVPSRSPIVHVVPCPVEDATPLQAMQLLELLTCLDVLGDGVDMLFMDGSYPASLTVSLTTRFLIGEAPSLGLDALGREGARRALASSGVVDRYLGVCEILDSFASSRAYELADTLGSQLEAYKLLYHAGFETLRLHLLSVVLDEASRRGVGVFWLAKEYYTDHVCRLLGVRGLSDAALLGEVLRGVGGVYLVVSDVSLARRRAPRPPRALGVSLSSGHESYDVAYYKASPGSPVLCLTYPKASEDLLELALSTLTGLSGSRGYPEPFILVHGLSVVRRGTARVLAERLSRSEELRVPLAMTPRERLGMR